MALRELHLFAGAGGGILGGILLGHEPVCAVELEEYPRSVLLQRQRDGILPWFPVWDDVCTFDGRPWRGRVDVICGGFPCQDISSAGKGAGIEGSRSGLWSEFARIIGEVRPRYVFVENSPLLTSRGLHRVLGDLAALGFDAEWGVLGAHHAGAPHRRDRIWILANAHGHPDALRGDTAFTAEEMACGTTFTGGGICNRGAGCSIGPGESSGSMAHPHSHRLQGSTFSRTFAKTTVCQQEGSAFPRVSSQVGGPWETEPGMERVVDGVAHWVDRVRATGNGQVPSVAALAWRILEQRLNPTD